MRCRLVNQVVPHDALMARAYEIAATVRDLDPDARSTILDLYRRASGLPVSDALTLEHALFEQWRARRSPS